MWRGNNFVSIIGLKQNFLGTTKFGDTKIFGGELPLNAPWLRAYFKVEGKDIKNKEHFAFA